MWQVDGGRNTPRIINMEFVRKEVIFMAKKFQGSLAVLIILLICCWPAAIIYFFMKEDENDSCDVQNTRTCLRCGARIPINYRVCPYCGDDWLLRNSGPGSSGSRTNVSSGPATGAQYCTACGAALVPDGIFCNICGKRQ